VASVPALSLVPSTLPERVARYSGALSSSTYSTISYPLRLANPVDVTLFNRYYELIKGLLMKRSTDCYRICVSYNGRNTMFGISVNEVLVVFRRVKTAPEMKNIYGLYKLLENDLNRFCTEIQNAIPTLFSGCSERTTRPSDRKYFERISQLNF
jgi:hypothetical protein